MRKGLGRHNYRSAGGPVPSLVLDFAGTGTLDPRVTFSRSTTAPYYDGKTSVLAEQNLLLQSNTFSNAAWVATSATIASGVTDPAGGTTAFSMTATAGNATLYQTLTLTATAYTESIWIQRVTGTGTINLTLDGSTLSPVTITSSWAKYTYTATPSAGSRTIGIQIVTSGDAINIYGSQLENRSSATATNITTTTALTNYIPQLLTAPINAPRFDFNPVTGESLGLLIEQSSTNLLTYSADFSNSVYIKRSGATVNTTANIAPDGTQTANLVTSTGAGFFYLSSIPSAVNGVSATWTFYAKPYGASATVRMSHAGTGTGITFNFSTKTFTFSVGYTSSYTSIGNGWYRIIATSSAESSAYYMEWFFDNNNGGYLWGFQLEALAFPTSYIPTTSAQVTRAADIPPLPVSTWYSTTQGTWVAQVNMLYTGGTPRIVGATPSSKAPIEISSQAAAMFDNVFGVSTANTITANTTQKIAAAWTGTTGQVCLNGGTVASGSQLNGYANLSIIGIGYNSTSNDNFINGRIAKITYYPTALTSAQLQALTT